MTDRHKVISQLGVGGMATVYLAFDSKFDTHVAIKVLNKEFLHNDNIRKRFLAEARNMFKMSHPNIVKVTDLLDENHNVAFVMEYIEGETLKEYLERKGKLNDNEIMARFCQMLEAASYVHEQNLVHRDIKPSNFIIDKRGRVKLMDFGIAKNINASSAEYTQTQVGIQMGTPMYMSPEQVKSSKDVDSTTDIYSLGVILWQMIAGRKPYDSGILSAIEIQIKIIQEPLAKLDSSWNRFVERATQKSSNERYKSCNDWLLELNEENYNSTFAKKHDETIIDQVNHNQTNKYQSTNSRIKKSYESSTSDIGFAETINNLASQFLKQESNTFLKGSIKEDHKSAMVKLCSYALDSKNIFTPLVYCEMSILISGIIGWFIVSTNDGLCYLIVSPPHEKSYIFSLNGRSKKFHHATSITFYGFYSNIMAIAYESYENEVWKSKVVEAKFMKSGRKYLQFYEALFKSKT